MAEIEVQDGFSDADSDYSSGSQDASTGIALGFAEKPDDCRFLFRSFFPSKIGGKPAWLNPENIPKVADLTCQQCKRTLSFLLQLYAPLNKFEHCYHRTLFVFVCRNVKCCGKVGTLKVLRSQLPLKNNYYPLPQSNESIDKSIENKCEIKENSNDSHIDSNVSNDIDTNPNSKPIEAKSEKEKLENLEKYVLSQIESFDNVRNCVLCGIAAPYRCANCKNPIVWYCSKDHQRLHWFKAHRKYCKTLNIFETWRDLCKEVLWDFLFDEFEIIPDIEPFSADDINDDDIDATDDKTPKNDLLRMLRDYQQKKKQTGKDSEYSEEELSLIEQTFGKDFDPIFLEFQTRVSRAPSQVIRYAECVMDDHSCAEETQQLQQSNTAVMETEVKQDDTTIVESKVEMNDSSGVKNSEWLEPLWMGSEGRIEDVTKQVPKCDNCGGRRRFEFQIMPQLLSVLKQGINGLDWGTLVVYSCENSCGDGTQHYFDEFIHFSPSAQKFEERDTKTGEIG